MPVLYVEPPRRLRRLRRALRSTPGFKMDLRRTPVSKIATNLYRFEQSDRYAVSSGKALHYLSELRWHRAIRRAANELGILKPILWVSLPEMHAAIGRFNEQQSIYHVVDEYEGYTAGTRDGRRDLRKTEQQLLDAVDLTIVVSPELLAAKSAPGRVVNIVENAVDLAQFAKARKSAETPADLAQIPRPRLGYSGLVGQRLDLAMLAQLATDRPDWSLVMIGKVDRRECEAALRKLENLRNVHFLGEKDAPEVAAYVAKLDVGLLPYVLNTETTHISPLKMYEYLAVGIPVVSTDIPAARRKSNLVAVCETPEAFLAACEKVLDDSDSEHVDARLREAAENTWDHRVEQIASLVQTRNDAISS